MVDLLQRYSNHGGLQMRSSEAIRAQIRAETPDGNRNGRRVSQQTPKLEDDLVEQLIQAYLEGDSVYVLGRRFGIHRQTVSAHLRRAGIARRRQNSPTVNRYVEHREP